MRAMALVVLARRVYGEARGRDGEIGVLEVDPGVHDRHPDANARVGHGTRLRPDARHTGGNDLRRCYQGGAGRLAPPLHLPDRPPREKARTPPPGRPGARVRAPRPRPPVPAARPRTA